MLAKKGLVGILTYSLDALIAIELQDSDEIQFQNRIE